MGVKPNVVNLRRVIGNIVDREQYFHDIVSYYHGDRGLSHSVEQVGVGLGDGRSIADSGCPF